MPQENSTSKHGYTNNLTGRALADLSDEEIRSIADEWLLAALKGSELFAMQSAHIRHKNSLSKEDDEYRAKADAATAGSIKEIYRSDLKARRVGRMAAEADKQLALHGVSCDPDSETQDAFHHEPPTASVPYLKTCQELLKARVSFYNAMEQNARGDYTAYDEAIERLECKREERHKKRRQIAQATIPTQAAPMPPEVKTPSLTLSAALQEFMDDRMREGKWTEHSRKRAASKYELFQAIIDPDGDLPVKDIGVSRLQHYKNTLLGMPANRSKKVAYRDIPLPDLLADAVAGRIPKEDRMNRQTVINHCQTVIAFLSWAGMHEYHTNPAVSGLLRLDNVTKAEDERDPFTTADIATLFKPETYLRAGLHQGTQNMPDSGGYPSRFWIPLLGLFTGARLEELAQLHLDDIVLVNQERQARRVFNFGQPCTDMMALLREAAERQETLCLYITDDKEYQQLKNKASRRHVPLSSILVQDLGFLHYAASVFNTAEAAKDAPKDNGRLFPELRMTASSDKFSHKLSHWFARYRQSVGIEGKKVFHSFRHTIGFWCDKKGDIQPKAAARYLGHAFPGITFKTYSKDTLPYVLYESVTARFTDDMRAVLDIEGLKASTWAVGAILRYDGEATGNNT